MSSSATDAAFGGGVLVVGATGLVGSEVARLLDARGISTHAFVRDAEAAKRSLPPGVGLWSGDLAERGSVQAALRESGAERMFVALRNGPAQAELEANAYRAAEAAGVRYIVKLSTAPAVVERDGATSVGGAHMQAERALQQSGAGWTSLRANYFFQNLLRPGLAVGPGFAPALLAAEPAAFRSWFARARVSMVDARDVAAAAAALLASADAALAPHLAQRPSLTGPRAVSMADAAAALAALLDVRCDGDARRLPLA